MIGRRILNSELKENGKYPVYSANVFNPFGYIDNTIISEFNTPSVLWGIDGDWMVNYIPSKFEFTPTDHCGVLRVISDDFNSHYVALALQSIGEEMGFSRSYRASIDRIEGITIPKVSKALQDDVMTKIEILQSKILQLENNLKELEAKRTSIVLSNL